MPLRRLEEASSLSTKGPDQTQATVHSSWRAAARVRRVMGQFEFSFEARRKSSALTNSMATDVRAPQLSFA
jgi:hypothetical protein